MKQRDRKLTAPEITGKAKDSVKDSQLFWLSKGVWRNMTFHATSPYKTTSLALKCD